MVDIQTRILRTPSDPSITFSAGPNVSFSQKPISDNHFKFFADPLRIIRCARFMADKGFSVSPEIEKYLHGDDAPVNLLLTQYYQLVNDILATFESSGA